MSTKTVVNGHAQNVVGINSRIKPGDVVRLKTGGPVMTVMRIVKHKEHKDDEAECYWWDVGIYPQYIGGVPFKTNIPWGKMFPLPGLVKAKARR
jgi:uncharacterized protein YodC (DUF2158 family)